MEASTHQSTEKNRLRTLLEEARLFAVCAFYVSCNFVPFALVLWIIGAFYYGLWWCRLLMVLTIFDYLIPLRPGPRGHWEAFVNWTSTTQGASRYNDAEIIVEGDYDEKKNYCVCYFPHGLYGYALFLLVDYFKEKHGIRFLFTVADVIFQVPLLRRIMTWWGATSCSSRTLKNNLQLDYPNNVVMLEPDGIAGMFYGIQQEQIVLDRRKGFCRIALQTGASLVPCYVFGVNQVYHRKWGPDSRAARLSSKLRVSFVYWTGRWGIPFGCVPYACKMVVAMGPPIHVIPTKEPTLEQIETLHDEFVKSIKSLYDRHKHRMGTEWAKGRDRLYLETERPSDSNKRGE